MIIDIHSHVWEYPQHFNDDFRRQASRARAGIELDLTVRYEDYRKQAPPDVKTIVFGGKAQLSGLWVDDEYVARCVQAHPDTQIGFLSVDPTQPGWQDELREGHQKLGLRGIKLLPMYAGFRPDDPMLDPLWSTPRVTTYRFCCTPARLSWRKRRSNVPCRAISMWWQLAFPMQKLSWRIWAIRMKANVS